MKGKITYHRRRLTEWLEGRTSSRLVTSYWRRALFTQAYVKHLLTLLSVRQWWRRLGMIGSTSALFFLKEGSLLPNILDLCLCRRQSDVSNVIGYQSHYIISRSKRLILKRSIDVQSVYCYISRGHWFLYVAVVAKKLSRNVVLLGYHCITRAIQSTKYETWVYTPANEKTRQNISKNSSSTMTIMLPGHWGSAQLLPQETMPCWTAVSPLPENNGPPESPWHASIPP